MDRFSPVASACIRVQVLPVGHIDRALFLDIVQSLRRNCAIVPLTEVNTEHVELGSLSPAGFRQGRLLFNFTTSHTAEQYYSFAPFELFREPLLVLGIVDGLSQDADEKREELGKATEYLREKYPRVVDRQLFVVQRGRDGFPVGADNIFPVQQDSMHEVVRLLSSRFLSEFATYARATQAMPNVQTPGNSSRPLWSSAAGHDALNHSSRPSTPTNGNPISPVKDGSPMTSPARSVASPPPATNFDQIQTHRTPTNGLSRSDSIASTRSRTSNRASSQERHDRAHVPGGFGPNASVEKTRARGKARVGIVTGHIHLMAGQWNETLRVLIEHTNKARLLGDHIWHAKGLEGLTVCLLLLAWANVEFSVPSICYSHPDRAKFVNIKRLSQGKDQPATYDATPTDRLAHALPELVKMIISLYRAGEGQLEIPYLISAETYIRFAKLLAVMHQGAGSLTTSALRHCVEGLPLQCNPRTSSSTKSTIVDMLSHVQALEFEGLPVADRIAVLAGTMSVFSLLKMDRRRAMVTRELLLHMTIALAQARKLGAAEAGIHPAAILSAETSTDAVLSALGESDSVRGLLSEQAALYGALVIEGDDTPLGDVTFGNPALRMEVLQELLAFCEAFPDPHGVLRFASTLLRNAVVPRSLEPESSRNTFDLRKDEQLRVATIISRTAGMSKGLGLSDAQASFWDPALLRGLTVAPLLPEESILDRFSLSSTRQLPENPLLYVPNNSRPATAKIQTSQLILGEPRDCELALQNTSEIALEVESILVVADSMQLDTACRPFLLGPRRLQKVIVTVTPSTLGGTVLTGCKIKISGCRERYFSLDERVNVVGGTSLLKHHGSNALTGRAPELPRKSHSIPGRIEVIPKQPLLSVKSIGVLESNLMLLDGETKSFDVQITNISEAPAVVFRVQGSDCLTPTQASNVREVQIPAGETFTFSMLVIGRVGVSNVHADFFYSAASSPEVSEYARKLSFQLDVTVNNAMRLQNPIVGPADHAAAFAFAFDLGNAWPKPLSYRCLLVDEAKLDGSMEAVGSLAPGQLERVHVTIRRWPSLIECNDVAAELRRRLQISWEGDGRAGRVNLEQLQMGPDLLAQIRGPAVESSLRLVGGPAAQVGRFAVVEARLYNRTANPTPPLCLQLQPFTIDGRVCSSRHIALAGPSQHLLAPIPGHDIRTVCINVVPHTTGNFDLVTVVQGVSLQAGAKVMHDEWAMTQSLLLKVE